MKTLQLFIFTALLTGFSYAQTWNNVLSTIDFNNIEIDGHKLLDIKNTQGDITAVETMFGTALETRSNTDNPGQLFSELDYSGLSLGFFYNTSTHNMDLVHIEITQSNHSITIKGVTVTIGSKILRLGDVLIDQNRRDENESIEYSFCDGCDPYISIIFDPDTGRINRIIFIDPT